MAIQDLEVIVTVNVSKALESLQELQESLEDIADEIERVDRRGTQGININSRVESIDGELAELTADILTWEARNKINVRTDVDGLNLRNLDDIVIRREHTGPFGDRGGDSNVAKMNVDAGVVNIEGLNLQGLEDTLRNSFRKAFGDLGSEDGVFISGVGSGDDDDDDDDDRSFRRRMRDIKVDLDSGDIRWGRAFQRFGSNISEFAGNSKLANVSMSDMHNVLARVIPLLIVLVGTLPALIGALATLAVTAYTAAAAMAALAGLGALGFAMEDGTTNIDTERFQEMLADVRQDFLEAFAPLANRLEPLFRDGLDGLEKFFQALANEGDALIALSDEARAFGGFLIDFIPDALRDLAALVSALSSEFGGIGRFLEENFTRIIRGMVETTVQSLPAISELLQLIAAMLPPLIRMSIGFVRVTTMIFKFFSAIGNVISILGINAEALGFTIALTLALATAVFTLTGAMKFFSGTIIAKAVGGLVSWIFAANTATLATAALSAALRTLLILTGVGAILVGASALVQFGSSALSAKSDVDKLNDSMRDFNRLSSGMSANVGMSGSGPSSGSGGGGSNGGRMSMTYNDYGGESNADQANAYAQWRYGRTTGDQA